MEWLDEAHGAQLLGFLPTMHKARRGESRQWLDEQHNLAHEQGVPVFPAIADLSSIASYRLDGHPYAPVAVAVELVLRSAALV